MSAGTTHSAGAATACGEDARAAVAAAELAFPGWSATPPADLLTSPPHSLYVQSYKPREMTSGVVNADGWGAALWLDDGRPEPALYRSAQPIWADPNLSLVCDRLPATAAVAAVRSATPGIPYQLACVQPFARGRVAFLHNGFVTGWQQGPARLLREGLGDAAYQAVQGGSDSEGLFALLLDALDRGCKGCSASARRLARRPSRRSWRATARRWSGPATRSGSCLPVCTARVVRPAPAL